MDALIAAVRAEEAKYRDIEYAIRITARKADPTDLEGPGAVTSDEIRRVVLQGDRIFFRSESVTRVSGTEWHQQEVSAFDGERTRTVVVGNSVNVHLDRFEHPDVQPVHSLPLIHYCFHFPLSVYLGGTEAIHAYPKQGRYKGEGGSPWGFTKVEAHLAGEEQVDGLRCLKIRVDRWYRLDQPPALQYLWLAPERNDLCVKEQLSWPKSEFGDLLMHEMHVDELREIAPGVWFPMKISVVDYNREALREKKRVVDHRTETVVEQVDLNPRHDLALFHDIEIPAGLPVFTIQGEALVGSSVPEPVGDEAAEQAKLEEVVARVREQEQRYAELEVKARSDYKVLSPRFYSDQIITEETAAEHSVLHGDLAYWTKRRSYLAGGGRRGEENYLLAFDGQWTRGFFRVTRTDQEEQRFASLRKGGGARAVGCGDGIPVLRAHTLLELYRWLNGSLADLLVSPWYDKVNKYRMRYRYCGEEDLDGHPCIKLRREGISREGQPPDSCRVCWLATDRNFIPLRMEQYGNNFERPGLPTEISRCDDFREIAPGVWYPFRATILTFENQYQRRFTINQRRVYEVESVTLAPAVDPALFHDVILPAGTQVGVSDEDHHLGQFEQAEEGVAELTPACHVALQAEAKVRDEQWQARRRAVDALIGQHAPAFPEGATWYNSQPLTWDDLRGKVVILDFWAEWCAPCRNDLPQLSLLHKGRGANGLIVIGMHTAKGAPEAIKKVMDEFHLEYPICVDVPPRDGVTTWGDVFGQFAVQAIPHAVAVDGRGIIVACGRLQDVLARALDPGTNRA